MRRFLLALVLSLTICSTKALAQDSLSFLPHHVGDVWEYYYAGGTTSRANLTKDSVVGNSTYLYYNGSDIPAFSIDSLLNVVYFPTTPQWRSLLYRLGANIGERWICDTTGAILTAARIESIQWGSQFGVSTQIMKIGYYYAQQVNDSIVFINWRNDEYLAAGFGFVASYYDPPQAPTQELIGCIIDGNRYGSLVDASEEPNMHPTSSFQLHACFPNPFNPSTTISYSLPKSGKIDVSVYDVLGRRIVNLIDEFQDAGHHSVLFKPNNLPSGVYFVRATAPYIDAVSKIIYSK